MKGDFKLALAMREDPKALRVRAATPPAPHNRRPSQHTGRRIAAGSPAPTAGVAATRPPPLRVPPSTPGGHHHDGRRVHAPVQQQHGGHAPGAARVPHGDGHVHAARHVCALWHQGEGGGAVVATYCSLAAACWPGRGVGSSPAAQGASTRPRSPAPALECPAAACARERAWLTAPAPPPPLRPLALQSMVGGQVRRSLHTVLTRLQDTVEAPEFEEQHLPRSCGLAHQQPLRQALQWRPLTLPAAAMMLTI